MKYGILGIIFAFVVFFGFHSAYGYEVFYEKWGPKIQDVSTVCIIEPDHKNSEVLSEMFVERLMDQSRISVEEWQVQLQSMERGRDKSMWEIDTIPISVEEQEGFDYDQCHVFIKFEDKPESQDEWYKLLGKTVYELGDTGRSDITIYYNNIKFCKTEDKDWIYFDPCYEDLPRLMQQLQTVVKHEFGHALGLGHYKADDIDVSVAWARGTVPAPSIMAVFSHQNLNENVISPKDIIAVRSIYGENGFLPDEEKIKTFDTFQPSSELYVIPKGGFTTASVEGLINHTQYISGVQVEITVIDPNQNVNERTVRVSSDGTFSYETIIDETILNGTYTVFAKYRDVKSHEVAVEIQYEGEDDDSKIPQWIKNSVRWWAEDKINEHDFILGIQDLIRKGILNPPNPENLTIEEFYDTQIITSSDTTERSQISGVKIPKYVKQTSFWWVEGKISDKEFVDGIQYLIKKGYLII
ncbi:MAG: hypothetical protein GTN35_05020 [Nitrososphaeria archaeon]|nr:hypothetical protein [Nitrosopumilaceae archaeon]NIP09417.1 hypothetical protein [Nitrosopumilaceae archaeon]NIP91740.1 hypothetical protein [Nitrososphaeria archaeon]NIS95633.1 hypothetical protein [Nitrosopumilaceae archaeon]